MQTLNTKEVEAVSGGTFLLLRSIFTRLADAQAGTGTGTGLINNAQNFFKNIFTCPAN